MYNKRLWLVMFVLTTAVLLAGCFGGSSKTPIRYGGSIQGVVRDREGKPIQGVAVMSPDIMNHAPERPVPMTDDKGRYSIIDVPAGTYVLNAAKHGWLPGPGGGGGDFDVYFGVTATVKEGQPARAPDLIMHRAPSTSTGVTLTSLVPQMHSELLGGATTPVRVDVTYSTDVPAVITAVMVDSNERRLGDALIDVVPGGSTATLEVPTTVSYEGHAITLQLAMFDRGTGQMLDYALTPRAYGIRQAHNYGPPTLALDSATEQGVLLSWSGGAAPPGAELRLMRHLATDADNLHTQAIAFFHGAEPGTYLDTDMYPGESFHYQLVLVHPSGHTFMSHRVTATHPIDYVRTIEFPLGQGWSIDSLGRYFYSATSPISGKDGTILVVDAATHALTADIVMPDCSPQRLSSTPDGRYIAGGCASGDKAFVVDTADNYRVDFVADIRYPHITYFHPETDSLYVICQTAPGTNGLVRINLTTDERTVLLDDVSRTAAYYPEAQLLIIQDATLNNQYVRFYDAITLDLLDAWFDESYTVSTLQYLPLVNAATGVFTLHGNLLDLTTKQQVEYVGRAISAISPSGRVMYSAGLRIVEILTWNGLSWQVVATVQTPGYTQVVPLPGDEEAYIFTTTARSEAQVVDLKRLGL